MDLSDGQYELGSKYIGPLASIFILDSFLFYFPILFLLPSFSLIFKLGYLAEGHFKSLKTNWYIWVEGKLSISLLNFKKEIY